MDLDYQNWANLAIIITPFATIVLGLIGLRIWRREYKFKIQFETANKILEAITALNYAMNDARNPRVKVSEMIDVDTPPNEDRETYVKMLSARINLSDEKSLKFTSLILIAELYLSTPIAKKMNKLNEVYYEYKVATSKFITDYVIPQKESTDDIPLVKIIFATEVGEDPSDFELKYDEAQNELIHSITPFTDVSYNSFGSSLFRFLDHNSQYKCKCHKCSPHLFTN